MIVACRQARDSTGNVEFTTEKDGIAACELIRSIFANQPDMT
jgi:hypothetical protein